MSHVLDQVVYVCLFVIKAAFAYWIAIELSKLLANKTFIG
jgi:hypothetical protein